MGVTFDKTKENREYEWFYWYEEQAIHFGTMYLNDVNKDMGSLKLTTKAQLLITLMTQKFKIVKNRTEVILRRLKFILNVARAAFAIYIATGVLLADFEDPT